MHVALSAASAAQYNLSAVVAGHIANNFSGSIITNNGSLRNFDHQTFTICSMTTTLSTFFSIFCYILSDMTKIDQRVQTLIYFEDDVSASAAVSAIRAAVRDIKLTTETYMTIASLTGLDKNLCLIGKHIHLFFNKTTSENRILLRKILRLRRVAKRQFFIPPQCDPRGAHFTLWECSAFP